jgi:flagellar protein FlbD
MIWATRLNGNEMVINADLIESIEATPDTVITLIDGKKYIVGEPAAELVARIVRYRAAIIDCPTTVGPSHREGTLHLIDDHKRER